MKNENKWKYVLNIYLKKLNFISSPPMYTFQLTVFIVQESDLKSQ
jgi:hypothetical protein